MQGRKESARPCNNAGVVPLVRGLQVLMVAEKPSVAKLVAELLAIRFPGYRRMHNLGKLTG